MACLVHRNADRRDAVLIVNALREADHIPCRVIIIGQFSGNLLDSHIRDAVVEQKLPRSLCTGDAAFIAHLAVSAVRCMHMNLCSDRNNQR